MKPHYEDDVVTLWHGDNRTVLAALPSNSVDSCVTDPPYELGFMGRRWDSSGIAYDKYLWAEVWRVLKPGGHLLAFGGTRTWHRLACAIEDAGFEIRDSIAWMYASGFPKSLDVSKAMDKAAGAERQRIVEHAGVSGSLSGPRINVLEAGDPITPAAQQWQGWGTALKPAFEPIVVARKPLIGTVAENVQRWGTGAINVDGCRIGTEGGTRRDGKADQPNDAGWENMRGHGIAELNAGRWPANVILDESQAVELDKQSGIISSGSRKAGDYGLMGYMGAEVTSMPEVVGDTGGASRFFYTAKASSAERPKDGDVAHPTVKPLDLMRYLVRLVTPPGGTVLEPFAGSGTTAEACIVEGFSCIAIEREADYLPLILQRITKPIEVTLL